MVNSTRTEGVRSEPVNPMRILNDKIAGNKRADDKSVEVQQSGKGIPLIVKRGIICLLVLSVIVVGGVMWVFVSKDKSGGGHEVTGIQTPRETKKPGKSPKSTARRPASSSPAGQTENKSNKDSVSSKVQILIDILSGKDMDNFGDDKDAKKFISDVKEQYGKLGIKDKKAFKDTLKKIFDVVDSDEKTSSPDGDVSSSSVTSKTPKPTSVK